LAGSMESVMALLALFVEIKSAISFAGIILGEKHVDPEVVGGKEHKYAQHYKGAFDGQIL